MFRLDQISFARRQVWHFIIGHSYITVGSCQMYYGAVVTALFEELGEEFKKPFVLVSVMEMYTDDYDAAKDAEIFDYEFGV
jgi:hypothetical protein